MDLQIRTCNFVHYSELTKGMSDGNRDILESSIANAVSWGDANRTLVSTDIWKSQGIFSSTEKEDPEIKKFLDDVKHLPKGTYVDLEN